MMATAKIRKIFMGPMLYGHFRCLQTLYSIMVTSSNGNISRVTGYLCADSPVTGEFPTQRPVTWSFDGFFNLRLNNRLSKRAE